MKIILAPGESLDVTFVDTRGTVCILHDVTVEDVSYIKKKSGKIQVKVSPSLEDDSGRVGVIYETTFKPGTKIW